MSAIIVLAIEVVVCATLGIIVGYKMATGVVRKAMYRIFPEQSMTFDDDSVTEMTEELENYISELRNPERK